jgi:hypothetical protein
MLSLDRYKRVLNLNEFGFRPFVIVLQSPASTSTGVP